ncbi:hypothetical protein G3I40_24815 [Streptomyces sp. SID14478]|uniref:hypothetical protein n=1 Tax=Streptomyces sp. SID14478 TaxID=2706073 RepID=UPI0013DCBF35|nr:hypothetical protein [Streptomyces sp. SID14478]NEB78421.1 hypothetical protein [Streptomyces sp. SID14478]
MSLNDDLTTIQRCVDDLARTLGRVRPQLDGPDLRRVCADSEHLRESVALLRASAGAHQAPPRPEGLVPIPDTPYDSSLWTGTDGLDDEGLGAGHRHAP